MIPSFRPGTKYKKNTAKYFNVSVWSGKTLCGLAIGKPSRTNCHCSLCFIEGAPFNHPLKRLITPLVIDVLKAYTLIIGGDEIRVTNPDMRLKDHYEKFGFKLFEHRKVKVRRQRNEEMQVYDGETYYEMSVIPNYSPILFMPEQRK